MSYDLKYQSDFYNVFKTLVSVKVYKKDYGVHDLISLRTAEVSIEFNFQDRYTPINGTGAKVVFINEGEFSSLKDLLTSLEKQFLCTIEYNGVIVFQGFSICDLNEQQFMPKARIAVQFTDYLRRLESDYLDCINDIGTNTSVFNIVQEALDKIALNYPLYVNSTLFEENMNQGATDTFLEQTFVEDNMFFTTATEYDNTYEVINKVLKSFGALLYSNGNKWVIERFEDITRTGNWVWFNDISSSGETGATIGTLKVAYNRQADDFKYIDGSPVLQYDSGLKTLILDLKDKQLGSLVFNNYDVDMLTTSDVVPDPGSLTIRTWYRHDDVVPIITGYSYRGMNTYFKWMYEAADTDYFDEGLYYEFELTFNISDEIPTVLSVSYKMSGEVDLVPIQMVTVTCIIRVDGGAYSGYYLGEIEGPVTGNYFLTLSATPIFANVSDFDVSSSPKDKTWSVNTTFNLSDDIMVEQPTGPPSNLGSIWSLLGSPTSQKFIIMFFPSKLTPKGSAPVSPFYSKVNYLGDVEVTITQQEILNKITYDINEDFIKTETVDIDFFDLANVNFGNGLLRNNGTIKTEKWISENNTVAIPITDILAKDIFRNGYRTTHKLKASIQCDKYLKPFSILTDNNLDDESANDNIQLILLGYSWDLYNGTYDIEAIEYTDEEIIIDAEALESSGGGTVTDPNDLTAPADLAAVIQETDQILVTWTEVIGATGYILRRVPSWKPTYDYWAYDWITVYSGANNFFMDDIEHDTGSADFMDSGTEVSYQVCAIISTGYGPYSTIVNVTW